MCIYLRKTFVLLESIKATNSSSCDSPTRPHFKLRLKFKYRTTFFLIRTWICMLRLTFVDSLKRLFLCKFVQK